MQTSIAQQIRDLTTQLNVINLKLAKAKSDDKIRAFINQNDLLVKKRYELAKKLGLTSWDVLYNE